MLRRLSSIAVAAVAGFSCCSYWRSYYEDKVAAIPLLIHRPDAVHLEALGRCSLLEEEYRPTFWMAGAHAQSVLGALLRSRPNLLLTRRLLPTNDGGQIAVDTDADTSLSPEASLLLIFPGLTGGSHSKYIQHVVLAARAAGMRSIVMNYRGYQYDLKTPMVTTSADVSDLRQCVKFAKESYPRTPVYALGFSMGANSLVKMLGEAGRETAEPLINGAMCVSNPFDYVKLSYTLRQLIMEWLYSRPLAWMVKKNISACKENLDVLKQCHQISQSRIGFDARTIYELDDNISRHLYGFDSVEKYYEVSSSIHFLSHVNVPLLVLNALDDPFFACDIPLEQCAENRNIALVLTRRGGHLGWTTGALPFDNSWIIPACMEYFQELMLSQGVSSSPLLRSVEAAIKPLHS